MKKYTMFKQVCNLIPPHLINRLAEEYGVEEKSRTFTPWSHVLALVYAHMTHAIGLNDVCAGLQDGEIVIFDKAYIDFSRLRELTERGVYWVWDSHMLEGGVQHIYNPKKSELNFSRKQCFSSILRVCFSKN